MENFDYIEDVLLNVDEGKIVKKKKSCMKPLGLLLVGGAILYFAGSHMGTMHDMLSSVILMVGLGVLGWGLLRLS